VLGGSISVLSLSQDAAKRVKRTQRVSADERDLIGAN
jgi:hypothetical protein